MKANQLLFWFASPPRADALAAKAQRPLLWLAAALALPGLWLGFVATPADAVQGEGYRLIYLHVPASWLAMFCYAMLALWSAIGLVWRTKLSFVMARALLPSGLVWAVLSLATGALWGRPMWGTWWVWDARLTSSLLLLLLYLGLAALQHAHADGEPGERGERGERATALLAVLGALNLPVIYFSVRWWNTLHQGASIGAGHSSMDPAMLAALLLCCAGAWAWTAATVLARFRLLLADRLASQRWMEALQAMPDAATAAPSRSTQETCHA